MASKLLPETVAALIVAPGEDLAFFEFQGVIYFSRVPRSNKPRPFSAVTQLIQGIYERNSGSAQLLLRQRIFTTAKPTEMCTGMVKMAAKAITHLENVKIREKAEGHVITPQFIEVKFEIKPQLADELTLSAAAPMSSALKLSTQLSSQLLSQTGSRAAAQQRYHLDRPIAAVLVSPEGKILAAALNSNGSNRTLHAEVNLVQGYYGKMGKIIPRGARIYTTLQPCKMCCGMIFHSCDEAASLKIYYAKKDPVAGRQKRAPLTEELTGRD